MYKFLKKIFGIEKAPNPQQTLANTLVAHIDKAGLSPTAPNSLR